MLSAQDNERLTRIGPGTVMGDLLRQYWQPALLSRELPEPDGAPLRLRLLGEDLVAFRASSGQVGVLAAHCPHRGTDLFYARNEADGLRCIYHGWKFDVTGACVDLPNEPDGDRVRRQITQRAYPCAERRGVVWVYMGPRATPPALPDLEWNLVPESHAFASKAMLECNWVQALEGGLDTSHTGFLHFGLLPGEQDPPDTPYVSRRDRRPRFEVHDMPYGLLVGAQRDHTPDTFSYHITQFLMPFHSYAPGGMGFKTILNALAWVPIDDEHTMTLTVSYHPGHPLTDEDHERLSTFPQSNLHPGDDQLLPPTGAAGSAWRTRRNAANDYLIDREAQRKRYFSGIGSADVHHTRTEDAAVQESMGPISDRSQEHLVSSDAAIVAARALLLGSADALARDGSVPPGVDNPEAYAVRSFGVIVGRDESHRWVELSEQGRVASAVASANVPGGTLDDPAGD